MSVRAPIGVVGLITPWNFPIAIATWKAFPAIVSGNTVVWKPATETPLMAYEMAKILEEVGLPEGVANVVFGAGSTVGTAMIEHPDVKVISFTGSTETGSKVAELGGKHLKKVSLEMGGKNAVIVMDDANLQLAVDAIIWSAFGTAGQRCTACSRVIVHKDVKTELESMLVKSIGQLTIGDGLDPTVKVGPVINQAALEKINRYVEIGKKEGATLLVGGRVLSTPPFDKGYYFEPTIFTDVQNDMVIAQEEIFGPVVSIIEVASLDEAIEVNNSVKFGLSSSIFSQDVNKIFKAQRDLDTGIVYVNAGTTGAEIHLPFGGTKGTGNGHRIPVKQLWMCIQNGKVFTLTIVGNFNERKLILKTKAEKGDGFNESSSFRRWLNGERSSEGFKLYRKCRKNIFGRYRYECSSTIC